MEPIAPPACNPHLKRVLKSYQSAALKSLNGPSNYVAGWGDPSKLNPSELKAMLALAALKREGGLVDGPKLDLQMSSPQTGPLNSVSQQMPLFLPMDSTRSEKTETVLEGETISCFVVGGEKRLCLPQILNTVLRDFDLQQINNICDELHIFCSRCNAEQLDILKVTGVLPCTAPSCGLITKTDAERLCNALLHRSPEKSRDPPSPNAFKVYHECFGKCKGLFSPELYSSPYAKCIECFDCRGMFSPQKFVVHSHKGLENRTCHWGFDSANWRSYLLLAKDQDNRSRCQRILDDIKARFDFTSRYKRKESPDDENDETKRVRYDENATPSKLFEWTDAQYRQSAFRPWSPTSGLKDGKLALGAMPQFREGMSRALPPYLQTGPPVLLHPERVIPDSESSRYERHFAPNVSLAPASQQKSGKDRDDDGDDIDVKDMKMTSLPDLDVRITDNKRHEEDVLDIDTSSSDFDSSVKSSSDSSVPSTPGADTGPPSALGSPRPVVSGPEGSVTAPPRGERKTAALDMLRRALDGGVGGSPQERDSFIEAFMKLQINQEDRLQALEQDNKNLRQENEKLRQQNELLSGRLRVTVKQEDDDDQCPAPAPSSPTVREDQPLSANPDLNKITTKLEALETHMADKKVPAELQQDVESLRQLVQGLANNNLKVKTPPKEEVVQEDARPHSPRAAHKAMTPKAGERINNTESSSEVKVSETNS